MGNADDRSLNQTQIPQMHRPLFSFDVTHSHALATESVTHSICITTGKEKAHTQCHGALTSTPRSPCDAALSQTLGEREGMYAQGSQCCFNQTVVLIRDHYEL